MAMRPDVLIPTSPDEAGSAHRAASPSAFDSVRPVRFAPVRRTREKGAAVAVDVRSEKLTELVDPGVEVEQLGTGFSFTEGPIWHPTEHFLLFSDMPGEDRKSTRLN